MKARATAWFAHLRVILKRRSPDLATAGVHAFQTKSVTPCEEAEEPVRAERKPVDPARHLMLPI
ncbi:MAG: hypothetical protein ACT4QA_08230 [Panacagrimonas sp.]